MDEERRFYPTGPDTLLGVVVGAVGGVALTVPYERSLGAVQAQDADHKIQALNDETAHLEFTKNVLLKQTNNDSNVVQIIEQEIAQRHQQAEAITAQRPNYQPQDTLIHTLEFGSAGMIVMGALATAIRYKIHKRKQQARVASTVIA